MASARAPFGLPHADHAYRVLGLAPDSSALRIKREYRRLAKLWHPDKFPHDTAEQRHAAERMRAINDAYRSIKHAPLRYRVYATGGGPVVTPPVPRTSMASDTLEYVVRFICGFLFGVLVSFAALVSDVPVAIAVAIPFATGVAAVVYGDRFWYWILEFSWALWP
jgi:DnaJ-domain-containing protein 1